MLITRCDALNSGPETTLGVYLMQGLFFAEGVPKRKRHNPQYLRLIQEQL